MSAVLTVDLPPLALEEAVVVELAPAHAEPHALFRLCVCVRAGAPAAGRLGPRAGQRAGWGGGELASEPILSGEEGFRARSVGEKQCW